MAQKVEDIFKRLQEYKQQQRELKRTYRDVLANDAAYQEAKEEFEAVKLKKKKIEVAIQQDLKSEFDQLEGLKLNIASDNQLLSDLALTQYLKGESIDLTDENQVAYEPVFSVRFKRV